MIELLLFILIVTEIALSVFLIIKINRLVCEIKKINLDAIKENSEKIKETVAKIKNNIVFFAKARETSERAESIKLTVNLIIAIITLLRNKKIKHK